MKLRVAHCPTGEPSLYFFWCPACRCAHAYQVEHPGRRGAAWNFDGNLDRPTFTPSLFVQRGVASDGTVLQPRCHLYLRAGRIQYLSDCEHDLRGQTVDCPEWPSSGF